MIRKVGQSTGKPPRPTRTGHQEFNFTDTRGEGGTENWPRIILRDLIYHLTTARRRSIALIGRECSTGVEDIVVLAEGVIRDGYRHESNNIK
ncbi:MAG: hypothetical protein ACKOB4_12170 [Acidobacteriota bacterium]